MSMRLTALLLAAALLWAGVVSHARANLPTVAVDGPAAAAATPAAAEGRVGAAAVDTLAVDVLPAPALLEHASDAPAVLVELGDAAASALTMARPLPARVAALTAPYLDGPQRPPCPAHFAA